MYIAIHSTKQTTYIATQSVREYGLTSRKNGRIIRCYILEGFHDDQGH